MTLPLKVAALATLMALVLGTLAAAALWQQVFSRHAISLLLLLPIALPGIVTGLALLTAFLNQSIWSRILSPSWSVI